MKAKAITLKYDKLTDTFTVTKLVNTTQFKIGDALKEKEVDTLVRTSPNSAKIIVV